MIESKSFANLVEQLSKLQGVGTKTATRYALNLLSMSNEDAIELSNSIIELKENIKECTSCGNYSEDEVCPICKNRSSSTICVVRDVMDIVAIEKTCKYKGVYHVLKGFVDPIKGITIQDLNYKTLEKRLNENQTDEVIIALNMSSDGMATAYYLAREIRENVDSKIEITTLAQGISIGSDLVYTDEQTISVALDNRRQI